MATGWLRGTVKEVVSGDTVVIMGPSRGGPPPEKRLTLASLTAPRMVRIASGEDCTVTALTARSLSLQARRDGSTVDDPFAWHSREYLRKKCIGQVSTVLRTVQLCVLDHYSSAVVCASRLQACIFKVDYVLENIPGREFGSVFLSATNENLALLVVSNGWSKVYRRCNLLVAAKQFAGHCKNAARFKYIMAHLLFPLQWQFICREY